MRVLVTGGRGFIGKFVMDELFAAGHVPSPFDMAEGGDVRNREAVSRAVRHCGHVIHLAGVLGTAELFDAPHDAVEVNVNGTLNVLQACAQWGAGYTGITMPASPWRNVYVATKHAAIHFAEAWYREYGVPVSHVRAYNAFGEGQRWGPGHPQKIVPTFAMRAVRGEPIPVWGTGNQTVDLVYAGDLGRMLVEAMRFGDCQTFDGGTGTALTVNEVARQVCAAADVPLRVEYLPMRAGETLDTNIIAGGEGWDLLGWHPVFDPECLTRVVKWYRGEAEQAA